MPHGNRDRVGNGAGSSRIEKILTKVLKKVESTKAGVKELKGYMSNMNKLVDSYSTSIK